MRQCDEPRPARNGRPSGCGSGVEISGEIRGVYAIGIVEK